MPGTKAQLIDNSATVVSAFNKHDYDTVGQYLDPNAIVRSVRPDPITFTQQTIQPAAAIINWMKSQTDNPTFIPTTADYDLRPSDTAAAIATIKGSGKWHDKYGGEILQ